MLPTNVARQAVMVRETARTVPERFPAKPDPAVTSELVEAVAAQRQVRIGYRTAAGNPRSFDVDPWSVVVRYGRWDLLCLSHHADALRTYRVDRITEVARLDGTFEVPADLDPAAELEANLAQGWEHETHVVFAAPLDQVRRGSGRRWATSARSPTAAASSSAAPATPRRTPVSGWPACRSTSRWSAATSCAPPCGSWASG